MYNCGSISFLARTVFQQYYCHLSGLAAYLPTCTWWFSLSCISETRTNNRNTHFSLFFAPEGCARRWSSPPPPQDIGYFLVQHVISILLPYVVGTRQHQAIISLSSIENYVNIAIFFGQSRFKVWHLM